MMFLLWDVIWFDYMFKIDFFKYKEYINYLENLLWVYLVFVILKYNRYLVKGGRLYFVVVLVVRMFKLVFIIKWEDG